MSNGQKPPTSKLKSYHIFLMSCLLTTFMILNSNRVNEAKTLQKENERANSLFAKIITLRNLDTSSEPVSHHNSDAVCALGSDDLNDYYKTGDASKIGLDNDGIKSEDKDKPYMIALRNIVKKLVDGDDDEDDDSSGDRLRRLGGVDQNDLMDYGKRILPMLVFLVFGILGIFGWIICCFCCCCDCCCCCCCKKEGCKIPCFIFTYVFYALVVAVCIYGLSQSNKIFEGIANTECSILKLLEQVVDGEIKQTTPRWIGISGINGLLDGLKDQINTLKVNAIDQLKVKMNDINVGKSAFTTGMTKFDTDSYLNGDIYNDYKTSFSCAQINTYNGKEYVLDLIKYVGHRDNVNNNYPDDTFLYALNHEYSEVAERTDGYVQTANTSFYNILHDKTDDVIKGLDKAKDTLKKLQKPFDKINNQIGDKISDYSKQIDEKGKLGVKLVFGVLMIMNVALGVFVIFIGLCSMKSCKDCCFCRCLFKFCTHLLWNILALLMILSFIIGSILSLVGRIGGDAMELVSYTLSEENLNNNEDPFLIGQAKDVKNYLKICLHGNGSLESEFDLGDSLQSIEDIDEVLNGLDDVNQEFNRIKTNLPTFQILNGKISERIEYSTDEFGIAVINEDNGIALKGALELLNRAISSDSSNKERWSIQGDPDKKCNPGDNDDGFSQGEFTLHPKSCKPSYRDWIAKTSEPVANQEVKDYATIVSEIVDSVSKLSNGGDKFIQGKVDLKTLYDGYLNSYILMIQFLKEKIGSLIGNIKEITGNGKIFSFVNGKFIGINIEIILKYLKYSLGKDLYTVGLCLDIVGLSLILSISSTLLLLSIINFVLKKLQQAPKDEVIPYQNNVPRQISMENY